jgi:hypothetical protein
MTWKFKYRKNTTCLTERFNENYNEKSGKTKLKLAQLFLGVAISVLNYVSLPPSIFFSRAQDTKAVSKPLSD